MHPASPSQIDQLLYIGERMAVELRAIADLVDGRSDPAQARDWTGEPCRLRQLCRQFDSLRQAKTKTGRPTAIYAPAAPPPDLDQQLASAIRARDTERAEAVIEDAPRGKGAWPDTPEGPAHPGAACAADTPPAAPEADLAVAAAMPPTSDSDPYHAAIERLRCALRPRIQSAAPDARFLRDLGAALEDGLPDDTPGCADVSARLRAIASLLECHC